MKKLYFALLVLILSTSLFAQSSSFTSYELFPDTDGNHINAHGAGVLCHNDTYYLYGEYKKRGSSAYGVSCYSSKDLYNWQFNGLALTNIDQPGHDIEPGAVIERPKVIYNAKTKKFVMWFHLELKGKGYSAARTAVAVSDTPTGPFKYIRSLRPNPGIWPMNYPEQLYKAMKEKSFGSDKGFFYDGSIGDFIARDLQSGQMARDMTLFVDSDQKAYHIHASEENQTLHICELTDDYLDFSGRYTRVLPGHSNEAPAICKYNGKYYMIASGCTGWAPNAARSAVAPTIWGPWTYTGNPCTGTNPHNDMGSDKTFGGQSTYLLPITGKDNAFIAMFDVWRPRNQQDSRYLWLPAYIKDGKINVPWQSSWNLSFFDTINN